MRPSRSDLIDSNIWNLKGEMSLNLIVLGSGSITKLGMIPINGFGELKPTVRQAQSIEGAIRISELFYVRTLPLITF
jgi:hypothetical protein